MPDHLPSRPLLPAPPGEETWLRVRVETPIAERRDWGPLAGRLARAAARLRALPDRPGSQCRQPQQVHVRRARPACMAPDWTALAYHAVRTYVEAANIHLHPRPRTGFAFEA